MFTWKTVGRRVFRTFPKEIFEKTKPMAANQGLYGGFLAPGLIWLVVIDDSHSSHNVSVFFLTCVSIAGIYNL